MFSLHFRKVVSSSKQQQNLKIVSSYRDFRGISRAGFHNGGSQEVSRSNSRGDSIETTHSGQVPSNGRHTLYSGNRALSSSDPTAYNARSRKLHGIFSRTIQEQYYIQNTLAAKLFIEALIDRDDPVSCVETILSSAHGLSALQASIRMDLTPNFFNTSISCLLRYLQAPDLRNVCGGDYLWRIVESLIDPPIFWYAFVEAHKRGQLDEEATHGFAWLLLSMTSLSKSLNPSHRLVAENPDVQKAIAQSRMPETRALGERIKHILRAIASPLLAISALDQDGPGGRHDNDFVDFRQIAIIPTADEVLSTQQPFLRFAAEVEQCSDNDLKPSIYLDNLFRTYREDLLREVREDVQIAIGRTSSKRNATTIPALSLAGVSCEQGGRRHHWSVSLHCSEDISQLLSSRTMKRQAYGEESCDLLRHQSLACLVADKNPAALVTINRKKDLVLTTPSTINVQILGDGNIRHTLLQLRKAVDLSLVQLKTAVFAYEPVLRRLQELKEIPLVDEVLFWQPKSSIRAPKSNTSAGVRAIIDQLTENPSENIQQILGLETPTILDPSQAKCLVASLTQRVSLTQGPPGK